MPSLTNRLKLALPNGNEYVNRAALNKIFEDIDRLVMLQGDFDTAKKEIDDNLAKKLSKSGDTMTGDLSMQANIILQGDTEKNLAFRTLTDNREFAKMYANPDKNRVGLYSTKNIKNVWEYDGSTDSFNVTTNTNLLKKNGDTMTGNLSLQGNGEKSITFRDALGVGYAKFYGNNDVNRIGVISDKNNKKVWEYDGSTDSFNVNTNTNLVKKAGDTMTGDLNFDVSAALKRISAYDGSTKVSSLAMTKTGLIFLEDGLRNNLNPWVYDSATQTFTVSVNTNLLKKSGDTMSGNLLIDRGTTGEKYFGFMSGNGTTLSTRWVDDPNNTFWVDATNNQIYMQYRKADKMFLVNSDTNLLKKTGDTMTGALKVNNQVNINTADENQGVILTSNASRFAIAPSPKGVTDWTKEISLNFSTGEVSVAALKVKGERALTISDAEEKTPSRSGKDENGIFTTYEETQEDGKLWKRSVLSSPDADGNYLVRTVTYYKDGVAYKTKIFDLKYDEDGDFVKAVPR